MAHRGIRRLGDREIRENPVKDKGSGDLSAASVRDRIYMAPFSDWCVSQGMRVAGSNRISLFPTKHQSALGFKQYLNYWTLQWLSLKQSWASGQPHFVCRFSSDVAFGLMWQSVLRNGLHKLPLKVPENNGFVSVSASRFSCLLAILRPSWVQAVPELLDTAKVEGVRPSWASKCRFSLDVAFCLMWQSVLRNGLHKLPKAQVRKAA